MKVSYLSLGNCAEKALGDASHESVHHGHNRDEADL